MRVVAISDTHMLHDRVVIPDGDLLIHAGDFCSSGAEGQARAFARFFRALPHRHKVVIAGNHDRCLEQQPRLGPALFELGAELPRATYLFDDQTEVEGLRIHGSPWQPWFLDWAFNLPRGKALEAVWAKIPQGIDILVTHGPPHGVLDTVDRTGEAAGCEALRDAIARVAPRVHVFGHIHEGYGTAVVGGTLYVNASSCTVGYVPSNPPVVFDIDVGSGPARRVDLS